MFSHIHRIIFFAILISLTTGCGPDKIEKLEEEVFALHDEVMPLLPEMKSQRRSLATRTYPTVTDSIAGRSASVDLHRADSLMWHWMYQYVPTEQLRDSLSRNEIEDYLTRQREMASGVNEAIKSAMKSAENYLKNK